MRQTALFATRPAASKLVHRNVDLIRTVSGNQTQILQWIQSLYCPHGFDLDATYGKGSFWKSLGAPRFATDRIPLAPGVIPAKFEALPFKTGVFRSVVFDPPFFASTGREHVMKIRYRSTYRDMPELWQSYRAAMVEFSRILGRSGVLVVKCQDSVYGRKQFPVLAHLIVFAETLGMFAQDIFILTTTHVPIAWNHHRQNHARKFHSYFIVFKKCRKGVFTFGEVQNDY
ncbi:MAG: hypothetical protein ABIL58_23470 [Pseudomonadota bacterium]